jgi:hypothetical protein
MVKGAWIVKVGKMRCKNWINGLEVVFHPDANGQPTGSILPPLDNFWDNFPRDMDRGLFLCRMWQRATIVFYRAYYQHLLKTRHGRIGAAHSR